MGAISGAATAGIGQAFGAVGSIGKELGRAGTHALAGGGISKLGGGDFWSGAAAGFIGSGVGSATHNFKPHWQIAGSALSGGIGAELGGGDFLQGAAFGGGIAAINHYQDRELSDEQLAKLKAKIESDGELTLREAKKWWKLGKGGALDIDFGKIDFRAVRASDFSGINDKKYINLFFKPGKHGKVYGTLGLKYLGKNRVTNIAGFDTYDFNMDGRVVRDFFTKLAKLWHGKGNPFKINFYGGPGLIGSSSPYYSVNIPRLRYVN